MGLSERKPVIGEVSLERMVRAVEKVRIRLLRAATILEQAKVPYAVAGGNAVAAWVARVDESAVRNTIAEQPGSMTSEAHRLRD